MSRETNRTQTVPSADETAVRSLYHQLLDNWNKRSANRFAKLFDADGNVVGFDGSPLNGQDEIESSLAQIFGHHQTSAYVGKIRDVRFLDEKVAVVRAVVGMVPPGKSDLDPAVNAIQTLVADKRDGEWRIALFQNTPAQFHGRPEMAQQLTEELRQLL